MWGTRVVDLYWFIVGLVWFGWRAVIAGNESNLRHGGNIANNYLRISENIFQQLREIRLTTHEALKIKAFYAITSKAEI